MIKQSCLAITILIAVLEAQTFAQEAKAPSLGREQIGLSFDTGQANGEGRPPGLSGEMCTTTDEERINAWSHSAIKSQIYCGADRTGFVMQIDGVRAPELSPAGDPGALADLDQYLRGNESVYCENPQIGHFGDVAFWAIACRDLVDGWPSIALVRSTADGYRVAFGAASALPYLAFELDAEISIPPERFLETAAELWSTQVPLASLADRHRVDDLWAAAREASERLDFQSAQAHLDTALELQVRLFGETDLRTAALLLDLAMVLAYQEDFEASDAIIRRAGPIVDQSPRPSDRARLAGYQSSIAALRGDFLAANQYASSASAQWRQIAENSDQEVLLSLFQATATDSVGAQPELALALAREGGILLKLDDPVSASAKAGEALLIFNSASQQPPIWRSEILAVLAEASSALGRLSAAERFFDAALTIRRTREGNGVGVVRLLLAQGRAYQREAMNVNSIITYRRAIGIAKELPRGSVALRVDDLIPFAEAVVAHAETIVSEDEKLGLLTELYDAFQLAFVPGRDDAVDLASLQISETDSELAGLVTNLKQALIAQSELSGKLSIERGKPAAERDDNLVRVLTEQLNNQSANTDALRNTLSAEHSEYQWLAEGRAPSLDVLRGTLGSDEALATFLVGTDASFIQLVTRNRIYITPIAAGGAELAVMVQALRRGLEIEGGTVNEFNLAEAHFLYQTLFGGVSEPLSKVNRLVVVPSGPLSNLPFGTLLSEAPADNSYRNAPWLVKRMSITHTPSIASFVNLRSTRQAQTPAKPFLGIANPTFSGLAMAPSAEVSTACNPEGIALPSRFDALVSLPDTSDEVRSVIGSLGIEEADLFVERDAKESVFRGDSLSQYNVIYVATHAVMPGEIACQTEPGIALARPSEVVGSREEDGFLDASEVAGLRISANLVVLSACNTATAANSAVQKGDALSGLAESFFIAGARSLLVTHWQVPSAATTALMRDMFEEIGNDRGLATDIALQRAQLMSISDEGTAHPFFWGAFSFVGSGQESVFGEEVTQ